MNAVLYAYPKQALFGRVLPKNKIYEHAAPSPALKALFIQQVEQIVWQYKLAPETINLPAKPNVPEIQIFDISLKTPELDESVLRCIDQAIPFPLIYQLTFQQRIKIKATYKRANEVDSSKWVIDDYFETDWQAIDSQRAVLPIALDLAALYEQLLRPLVPIAAKPAESLSDQLQRYAQIRSKQLECRKIENKLQQERQFNRKVTLNTQLRLLKQALEKLC